VVAAALQVALTFPMVNTNIPTLAISVHIVDQVLSAAVHTVHLESTSMNLGMENVVIADQVHTEVVRIVHLENMNIKKMGKVASQLNSNHH
jgi:hypothetical protein